MMSNPVKGRAALLISKPESIQRPSQNPGTFQSPDGEAPGRE